MTPTHDSRTPCPPLGYSRECDLPESRQIELVAEFHAYRIRPSRIAFRLGIDIALIDALLAGDYEPERFAALVARYRRGRYQQRVREADTQRGAAAFELRNQAARDLDAEISI